MFNKSTLAIAVAVAFSSPLYAEVVKSNLDASDNDSQTIIKVKDKLEDSLSGRVSMDIEEIRRMPAGDGNITDYLQFNPNVRIESSENGFLGGEIKPSQVSIHGADPYQTAFLLNGVNINNDLDPAGNLLDGVAQTMPDVSSEQGYFLDATMLSDIVVYDHNAPASLGGFTGGAVVANSRSFQGWEGFQFKYRTTNDSWTNMKVDDAIKDKLNEARPEGSSAIYQPDFKKHTYSASLEKRLSDTLGLVVGVSRRTSSISQSRVMDKEGNIANQDQERRSDNVLFNLGWTPSTTLRLDWDVRLSDYQEEVFVANNLDSNVDNFHNAVGTTLNWKQNFEMGTMTLQAAYDRFEDKRDANSNSVVVTSDLDTFLNYEEGGYGDSRLRQEKLQLSAEYALNEFQLAGVWHKPQVGVGVEQTDFEFYRPEDVQQKVVMLWGGFPLDETTSTALAGTVETDYRNYHAYIENSMRMNNFSMRAGLRVEKDDYLSNTNLAPRLAMGWAPQEKTKLNLGLNRYFGRSFASMKLTDGILKLNQDHTRESAAESDLETPYSDELAFTLDHQFNNFAFTGGYIMREYKDRLVVFSDDKDGVKVDEFRNGESFKTKTYTLQLTNVAPWVMGPTQWNTTLAADWLDTERSDLDKNQNPNEVVILDGQQMTRRQMEAEVNSSQEEWMVRFAVDMELPSWDIVWTNRLYVKAPIEGSEDVTPYDATGPSQYKSYDYGTETRWDTRLKWSPQGLVKGMYVQVDVENLLDDNRQLEAKGNANGDYGLYSSGRQFWLELGYEF